VRCGRGVGDKGFTGFGVEKKTEGVLERKGGRGGGVAAGAGNEKKGIRRGRHGSTGPGP